MKGRAPERRAAAGGPFEGKSFVLTGTLSSWSREEATKLIEAGGGRVVSSVSSRTSAVVAGEEPGGKLDKARGLGVEIWDEAQFKAALRRAGISPAPR